MIVAWKHRYVLLKERNRLLTMEEEYRYQHELFPSPERIDKVSHSFHLLDDHYTFAL